MNEFVIVKFADRRVVLVDDVPQGYNKDESGKDLIKELDTGNRKFALEGENNYTPSEQWVEVKDTDPIDPMKVVFQKVSDDGDDPGNGGAGNGNGPGNGNV